MADTTETADQPIAFDPEVVGDLDDDGDSTGDAGSLRESTASLRSSILEYRNINGRSFQSSRTTEYWAPVDEKHIEAFDIAHAFMSLLFNDQLFKAPIKPDVQRILDIGTGTGIWAIDMADQFPSAEVIGTDISAVQPGWVPPNCKFEIDDAQLDWTFPVNYFDFIHIRNLYGAIDDWEKLYQQAFAHCKPGGWFEHVDIDLVTGSENPRVANDPDHVFKQWCQLFFKAGDKLGRTFRMAENNLMLNCMKKAGFTEIFYKAYKVPIGGWPSDPKLKQIGHYNGLHIDQSLDGFVVYPIGEILGWSPDEVNVLVAKMRAALKDPKSLPYYTQYLVYGKKPGDVVSPSPSDKSDSPPQT